MMQQRTKLLLGGGSAVAIGLLAGFSIIRSCQCGGHWMTDLGGEWWHVALIDSFPGLSTKQSLRAVNLGDAFQIPIVNDPDYPSQVLLVPVKIVRKSKGNLGAQIQCYLRTKLHGIPPLIKLGTGALAEPDEGQLRYGYYVDSAYQGAVLVRDIVAGSAFAVT